MASVGPGNSDEVSATYPDGLPETIAGEHVYRVADVVRLDPSRSYLLAAWDRGFLPTSCPAQFPGATIDCPSFEALSDSPLGPGVLSASWPASDAPSPAMVVRAQIEPLPACWSDPAGGCPTIPTIDVAAVVWRGSGGTTMAWSELATPLRLPTLTRGAPCPRTSGGHVFSGVSDGLGGGPVYPVGLGVDGYLSVEAGGSGLAGKVLWIAAPTYSGPILLRGGRIDLPGQLQFSVGANQPSSELRLQPAADTELPGDWSDWPTETYVPGAGCYAFQVDGFGFSSVIVFEVTVATGG